MAIRYRLIPAKWKKEIAKEEGVSLPKIKEGYFTKEELKLFNKDGYNIYYFPNGSSKVLPTNNFLSGKDVDRFRWVFIDIDLKDKVYSSKISAIEKIKKFKLLPTSIVDSGNGVHAYWDMEDLNVKDYVKLQLQLISYFKSDQSVFTPLQLMRVPNFNNVKMRNNPKFAEIVYRNQVKYKTNDFAFLPALDEVRQALYTSQFESKEDKLKYLKNISQELPERFKWLLDKDPYVNGLFFVKDGEDRSAPLWALCQLLSKRKYTRKEITSIALNTPKVRDKGQKWFEKHVLSQLFTKNLDGTEKKRGWKTLEEIEKEVGQKNTNEPLRLTTETLDPFIYGYRPGDVMGLIGGSSSGKSTITLNMVREMAKTSPNYKHVYFSLEMSATEIYEKFRKQIAGDPDEQLIKRSLIVVDNEDDNGKFKNLSFEDIRSECIDIENVTNSKIGCVVIDNINILDKGLRGAGGPEKYESQNLKQICKDMKEFARTLNIFLIMQSQSSREKAGEYCNIPLFQDAAYGTSKFENYCTYVVTIWQPLRALYSEIAQDLDLTDYQQACRMSAIRYCKVRFQDEDDKVMVNDVVLMRYNIVNDRIYEVNEEDLEVYSKYLPKAKEDIKTARREKDFNVSNFKLITQAQEAPNVYTTTKETLFKDNNG